MIKIMWSMRLFVGHDHARIQHWTWEFPSWCQPPSCMSPPKNKSPVGFDGKSEKKGRLKFGLKKDSQLRKMDGWNRILNKIGAKSPKLSEQKPLVFLGRVSLIHLPLPQEDTAVFLLFCGAHTTRLETFKQESPPTRSIHGGKNSLAPMHPLCKVSSKSGAL